MAKKPRLYRPVKRFKSKVRGFHTSKVEVAKKGEYTIEHPCSPANVFEEGCTRRDQHSHFETVVEYIGVDPSSWVRYYPNPGYRRKNGNHWCKKYGRHPMAPRGDM